MGACKALGGNIITDAFGIVAMVAMTPLITIQVMGLITVIKERHIHNMVIAQPAKPAPAENTFFGDMEIIEL